MHILIIEDEEQLCRSIAEGLRMDGYETDTCLDGDEGLELCTTENYDLILLDLNLPGIDGLDILRQFRETNSSTPVLILSARGQIEDKVEGLDLGANDYLTKPFHFEELEARIRSLTRRRFIQENVCLKCGHISFDTRTRKAHGIRPAAENASAANSDTSTNNRENLQRQPTGTAEQPSASFAQQSNTIHLRRLQSSAGTASRGHSRRKSPSGRRQ